MKKLINVPKNYRETTKYQKSEYLKYVGSKFNELTILDFPGAIGKDPAVEVKCSCENKFITNWNTVKHSKIKSCGHIHGLYKEDLTEAACRDLFLRYKHSAKVRRLEFSLSFEDFKRITKSHCTYCGVPPEQERNCKNCQAPYIYNGIDRINTAEGYIITNCAPCCGICNRAKSDLPLEKFNEYLRRVSSFASTKSLGKIGESCQMEIPS